MKLKIRNATLGDIPRMVEVDRSAWWDEVAFTAEQFKAQIETYPEGVFVAEVLDHDEARLVGTICGLRAPSSFVDAIHTWSDATGNGYFTTHDPAGDVVVGANLSVLPEFERMGIGNKLFGAAAAVLVRDNMRYILLGGRLPHLAQHNRQRIERGEHAISGEDYARLRDGQGRILDPELRFYLRQPFMEFITVLPDYFPDPDSENYGVLLRWWNPLYKLHLGWVYRVPLLGKAIARVAASVVRAAV